MTKHISWNDTVIIGFMLFALFFGAGNLVFPPMLGQSAGSNVWAANTGFLITGVGLPLLCVIAFGFSGTKDFLSLTSRVHPLFGVVYTTALYLTIGPLFAMPRTGSVSFEIGIRPHTPPDAESAVLLAFTILYFGVNCLISCYPTRIVNIVGKLLTPCLIAFLAILAIAAMAQPLGTFQPPQPGYEKGAFFYGIQEGYLTMDALAAFVFGIIVVDAIRSKGAATKGMIMKTCLMAGAVSSALLASIYTFLAYIGASVPSVFGYLENGGVILAQVTHHYFGAFGGILLGGIVILACLTTSIGLTTSCSAYLHSLFPAVSYRAFAIGLSVFSTVLANFGLNELISFSVPVLKLLYPLAVMLIVLTFTHPLFHGDRFVYAGGLALTFIVSLVQLLGSMEVPIFGLHEAFLDFLPLYAQGLGWIVPALIGSVAGWAAAGLTRRTR